MTGSLIRGDQVSCSRVGGAMRRESSRLRQQAQSLADALSDLAAQEGPVTGAARQAGVVVGALRATADDLDEAGTALQRYATELAEGHELGRRAQRRVDAAGLLLEGTRVVEPWGPAGAEQAQRRRAQVPEVQSRVDLATAQVGRARGRLEREMARLTDRFTSHSRETQAARRAPTSRATAEPPIGWVHEDQRRHRLHRHS
jgi:hypothetical protein